jgi:hypothetical protein
MNTVWIIAALVVIALLAGIAVYYLREVRKLDQRRAEQRKELEEFSNERREHANLSIQVIAGSIVEDQMTLTEGAIRLRGLLESLGADEAIQEEFTAFYQLAKATEHIPIMEEWKKLKIKQKLSYDSERETQEKTHRDFVLDAAKRIKGRTF